MQALRSRLEGMAARADREQLSDAFATWHRHALAVLISKYAKTSRAACTYVINPSFCYSGNCWHVITAACALWSPTCSTHTNCSLPGHTCS